MSLAVRVIPCLDVAQGRVVKGLRFENLRDAGDPVEAALRYESEGADELAFLDIAAAHEERGTLTHLVEAVAEVLSIPFTVGGGVRSVEDAGVLLAAGADRVTVNTAAVADPALVTRIAERYGAQCVVVAVDGKRVLAADGSMRMVITTHGGRRETEVPVVEWVAEATRRGAGEILLTSVDADGTRAGFDIEMLRVARGATSLPLVASGGAGRLEHFPRAVVDGAADAVLAASVFHDRVFTVRQVKQAMRREGVPVRPAAPPLGMPLAFDERGLVPVVVRDHAEGDVLMLAWADEDALALTRETGFAHFFSRSRGKLWKKGETSGNVQRVDSISVDCDRDAVLYDVRPEGPACHKGTRSCFAPVGIASTPAAAAPEPVSPTGKDDPLAPRPTETDPFGLAPLVAVVAERARNPRPGSYTSSLLAAGIGQVAKKLGEEGVEAALAAVMRDDDGLASEAADLLYHLVVLLAARGLAPADVARKLAERARRPGGRGAEGEGGSR